MSFREQLLRNRRITSRRRRSVKILLYHLVGQPAGKQVFPMIRGQRQSAQKRAIGRVAFLDARQRILSDGRLLLPLFTVGLHSVCVDLQLLNNGFISLGTIRFGVIPVEIEHSAREPAFRTTKSVLNQVNIQMLFIVRIAAGAVDVVGSAARRRIRKIQKNNDVHH